MPFDSQSFVRELLRPFAGSAVLRALFGRPAYVIISVTVLGVSIAAQLIIVSIVEAMLVRPLCGPLRKVGRLDVSRTLNGSE